jgi:NADH-quinone oxidoreductase subunit H
LGLPWQILLTVVKAAAIIFVVIWTRASFPRLRIDQLMSFSWKLLLPVSFAQIMVNGLILVYDLPYGRSHALLAICSAAGVLFVASAINRSVTRPRPRPVLIPRSEAAAQ